MMRAMYAAVSGLKNHQTLLDVTANNIANVNTVGYKGSRVSFADSLSQTVIGATAPGNGQAGRNAAQVGLGVQLASIDNLMGGGSLQSTGETTDLAIQGEGMFIVAKGTPPTLPGAVEYTRAGDFTFNDEGYLTTQQGEYVMGREAPGAGEPNTYIKLPKGATDVAIACWPWAPFLGHDAVRMKVSSWTRHDHNTMPPAAKTVGNYVNSSLAKVEALKAGYDEAVMLAPNGLVAECTGENIFAVRNGIIITPPLSAGALEGITQDAVRTIARDLGYSYNEANLVRSDLYTADEAFLTGTAAEVVPVRSVDDREIGDPGPITRRIQEVFHDAVRGKVDQYKDWNEHV